MHRVTEARTDEMMKLTTADAIAQPSNVDVPRPSSSRITSERGVACASIDDVSFSSTKNVLCEVSVVFYGRANPRVTSRGAQIHTSPERMRSLAPTRVNTLSTTDIVQADAGTMAPICAKHVLKPW